MKRKGAVLLCSAVVIFGFVVVLWLRWDRERRVRAAFPPEVQAVLANSDKLYLYSLQAERLPDADLRTMPNFHGYPILGQTRVRATPERADLLGAVRAGLGKRTLQSCFTPHHGLRAVRGAKTVDLLIGFECEHMEIYDERGRHQIAVSSAAQQVFNHILAEYDVPLPEP